MDTGRRSAATQEVPYPEKKLISQQVPSLREIKIWSGISHWRCHLKPISANLQHACQSFELKLKEQETFLPLC